MIREVLTFEHLQRLGADEAATLLLIRQDAGDDGHDEAVFDEWLADPANAAAWTRVCGAWASFDAANDDMQVRDLREAVRVEPARARWGYAIAASIAVIAAVGGTLVVTRADGPAVSGSETQVASAGSERLMLTSAKGERRSFQLADASSVTLNTDSAVAVAFRPGGERRLELIRGQAFFKVTHDKTRPFVVAVDGSTVTALGTAFEVRAGRGATRVVLVEGRVRVGPAGAAPVELHAGQQLLTGPHGITVSDADIGAVDDWQRGVVTFKNTTLTAAAAELNRYSATQLIADPKVAQLTVSGVFRTDDARRFALTVEAILPVRVVASGERELRITPAE